MNYIERYWRDATPADAIKEPPMVARFRNDDEKQWQIDTLVGIDRGEERTWIANSWCTMECQVYDAPDPGEGWRLVDTERETPEVMDEYTRDGLSWILKGNPRDFISGIFYRRRITPTVTYVPFTWEDRDQLRGRWVRCADAPGNEWAISSMYIGGGGELRVNGVPADRLASGFIFLDTGEPVGKKVTQ